MSTDTRDLLRRAYVVARCSPDPSTQNGAILVCEKGLLLAAGHNQPLSGVSLSDWLSDPEVRANATLHAEEAAIFNAYRHPLTPTPDARMIVCPWAACAECAKAIIAAGVRRVVRHADRHRAYAELSPRWEKSIATGDRLMRQAGVEIDDIEGSVPGAPCVRMRGAQWNPVTCTVTEVI